jgi:hypothetical protein
VSEADRTATSAVAYGELVMNVLGLTMEGTVTGEQALEMCYACLGVAATLRYGATGKGHDPARVGRMISAAMDAIEAELAK